MPWQWLQELLGDPSAYGQAMFVWLCAIAIGISWYASRIPRRIAPSELDRLHRAVDDLKLRIRVASNQGKSVEGLQKLLDEMRKQLPSGDARR